MSSRAINPSEIVRSVAGAGLALAAVLLILPRSVLAAPSTGCCDADFFDSIDPISPSHIAVLVQVGERDMRVHIWKLAEPSHARAKSTSAA
jgi:hypothetical protein